MAWWAGEGNANDSVGTNHGNSSGGTGFVPGMAGQAFSFDGLNGRVTNGMAGLTNILNSYTVEFWFTRRVCT